MNKSTSQNLKPLHNILEKNLNNKSTTEEGDDKTGILGEMKTELSIVNKVNWLFKPSFNGNWFKIRDIPLKKPRKRSSPREKSTEKKDNIVLDRNPKVDLK